MTHSTDIAAEWIVIGSVSINRRPDTSCPSAGQLSLNRGMLATRWESAFSAEVLTLNGYVNLRGAQTLRQIEPDFSTRRPRLALGQSRWRSVSGSQFNHHVRMAHLT